MRFRFSSLLVSLFIISTIWGQGEPVAQYTFSGDSTDGSGNGNTAEIHGAGFVQDRFGVTDRAIAFDGSDDYVQINSTDVLENSEIITVVIWYSPNPIEEFEAGRLINKDNQYAGDPNRSYYIRVDGLGDDQYTFVWNVYNTNLTTTALFYTATVEQNEWCMLSGIYDGVTQKMFFNDSLVAEMEVDLPRQPGNSPIYLGRSNYDITWLNGSLDDVNIYDRALSEIEISQLFIQNDGHAYTPHTFFEDDFAVFDTSNWVKHDNGSNNVNIDETVPDAMYIDGARNWEAACRVTHEMHTGEENFKAQFDVKWTGGSSGAFATGWSATDEFAYIQSHDDYSTLEDWDDFVGLTVGDNGIVFKSDIAGVPVEGLGTIDYDLMLDEWYTLVFSREENTIRGQIWSIGLESLLGEVETTIPILEDYQFFHVSSWDNMMNNVHSYFELDNLILEIGDRPEGQLIVGNESEYIDSNVLVPVIVDLGEDEPYRAAELNFSGYVEGLEFQGIDTVGTMIGGLDWMWANNESDGILSTAFAGSDEISGEGVLCFLEFLVTGDVCDTIPVNCDYAKFNDTELVDIAHGSVYIQPIRYWGDVDLDGDVDSMDASDVLVQIIDSLAFDCQKLANADVYFDSIIDPMDASVILQRVVGSIQSLPVIPGDPALLASGEIVFPEEIVIQADGLIEIQIQLINGTNIFAQDAIITFDSLVLTPADDIFVEYSDNTVGFIPKYRVAGNTIIIAGASGNSNAVDGLFATLKFYLAGDDLAETEIVIESFGLNSNLESEPIAILVTSVATNDELSIPDHFTINQNYPNPFNPTTTISYGLPKNSDVSIIVYDVSGREVRNLIQTNQSAGWYDVTWNGLKDSGNPVSTGLYFARINAGGFSDVIKMVYLR